MRHFDYDRHLRKKTKVRKKKLKNMKLFVLNYWIWGRNCMFGCLVYFLFFHVFLRFSSIFFVRTKKSRKYFIQILIKSFCCYLDCNLRPTYKFILQKKLFVLHKWLKKPEKKCVFMKKVKYDEFFLKYSFAQMYRSSEKKFSNTKTNALEKTKYCKKKYTIQKKT